VAVYGGFLRETKKTGIPLSEFFPDIRQGLAREPAVGGKKQGKNLLLPGFRPGDKAQGFIPDIRGFFLEAGQNRRRQALSPEEEAKKFPRRRFPYQAVGTCQADFKKCFCLFRRFGLYDQARVKRGRRMYLRQPRQIRRFGLRGQEKFQVSLFKPFRRLLQTYPLGRFDAAGDKAKDAGKKNEKSPSDISSWAEYGSWFPK
jgi:hypothetical protein